MSTEYDDLIVFFFTKNSKNAQDGLFYFIYFIFIFLSKFKLILPI
jgi:hypothetical protein